MTLMPTFSSQTEKYSSMIAQNLAAVTAAATDVHGRDAVHLLNAQSMCESFAHIGT
jgi:hypothetical protein